MSDTGTTPLHERLRSLRACNSAVEWAKGYTDPERAWNECERGDWLIWLAYKLGIDEKLITAAKCDCAEPALKYVPAGEDRPRNAIEVARKWIRGEATDQELA